MQRIIYTILAATLLLQSCLKGDTTYEDNVKANDQAIQQYMSAKNLQLQSRPSGLWYKIINSPTPSGAAPAKGMQVVMSYVGKLTNDMVFVKDSNKVDRYLRFPFSNTMATLPGIFEAASLMKTGDSAVAVMPFYLGFGPKGTSDGKVPDYSVLVFDLKLVAVQTEDEALRDYIVRKGYPEEEVKKTSSGLYYYFTKTNPTGTPVSEKTSVTVAYKGRFIDGSIFDQTTTTAATFGLSQVIAGFSEGLKLMKTGESAVLMMPSSIAYKESGSSSIPPYAPLVFEVTVNSAQ